MFKLSETKIDLTPIDVEKGTIKELWNTLESNFANCLPFIEETIEKWNSRTKLIGNLAQNQSKKQQTSIFNATIVQQVNALLANEESRTRLVERTRSKRETYRVLGRSAEDLHSTTDVNIYNDHDFYQVLLSDFLQNNDDNPDHDGDGHDSETERRFLMGADLGLTHKYLAKKQRM